MLAVLKYGACLRIAKICIPHPGRMGQLAKICNGDYRERIAKICAPPKSYDPRMDVRSGLNETLGQIRERISHLQDMVISIHNQKMSATLWCLVMRVNGKSLETATWQ